MGGGVALPAGRRALTGRPTASAATTWRGTARYGGAMLDLLVFTGAMRPCAHAPMHPAA